MKLTRALPILLAVILAAAACDQAPNATTIDPITGQASPPVGVKRPDPKVADVTIDMIQQAVVTCTNEWPPGVCNNYTWTVRPNGFADCGADTSTYDGEITVHQVINFKDYCMWASPNAVTHASLNFPSMGDWTNAPLHTFTMNSRLHGGGIVFSAANYGGSFSSWLGPLNGGPSQTYRQLPWYIQSGSVNN